MAVNANTRNKVKTKKKTKPQAASTRVKKNDGFFTVHYKQAKASFKALWTRPLGNLLTLAVISMALALPACLYLMGKNVAAVSEDVTGPSQISAYIEDRTPEAKIMVLKDELEANQEIKAVEYISSQQGLAELSEYSGFDQAISLLDNYALPPVLIITPASDDTHSVQSLVRQLRENCVITDVRMDEDWMTRLDAIRTLVSTIVTILSLLMLCSVFLIVGNTLRFNVLADKEAIQTMKLIGATDGYILRPYLYSGMWFGLLGALAAWIFTAIITILLNSSVESLAALYDSQFRLIGLGWDETLLLLMLGTFIGCLAAKVSAQRHLKEIEPV